MRMTHAVIFVAVAAACLGCRGKAAQDGDPSHTIVVTRPAPAAPLGDQEYDTGERAPQRIEVVVAEPRGAGTAPSPLTSLVGRSVKVQFRRDALGLAATAPVPPTGQGPGGRAVSINGIVRSVTGGWLVLEREKNTYFVPYGCILLIEQSDAPTTTAAE